MIKEDFKIKVLSNAERREAQELLFSLGFGWDLFGQRNSIREFNDENIHVYIDNKIIRHCSDNRYSESLSNKLITLQELRELARPKEYLDENYQLQVTNQPKEGWILVPDGAELLVIPNINVQPYFYKYGDIRLQFFNSSGRWDNSGFKTIDELHKILWQRKKESEMNTEKKGRFLHQEWYEAFGRGDDVQFKHSTDNQWRDLRLDFHTLNLFNVPDHKFRLKPRTIQIGSRTINAPISVKPNLNDSFYISSTIHQDKYLKTVWHDSATDNDLLNRQICHLTADDAINMTDALLELMKEAK